MENVRYVFLIHIPISLKKFHIWYLHSDVFVFYWWSCTKKIHHKCIIMRCTEHHVVDAKRKLSFDAYYHTKKCLRNAQSTQLIDLWVPETTFCTKKEWEELTDYSFIHSSKILQLQPSFCTHDGHLLNGLDPLPLLYSPGRQLQALHVPPVMPGRRQLIQFVRGQTARRIPPLQRTVDSPREGGRARFSDLFRDHASPEHRLYNRG